jgi:cobalt-precorrin-5B (C1)-methyltransferase
MGPFFGDALRQCRQNNIERVSLLAMIGKLAKFAGGNDSVHSTASKQDFDFLARLAEASGADAALVAQVAAANTAQEVAQGLGPLAPVFFNKLCQRAWRFGRALLDAGCTLEVLLTGIQGEVLARSDGLTGN